MPEKKQFEFFLLRYVPDPIKDEFVNIGVVLLGWGNDREYVNVRMTHDWRRVLCMDPDVDVEMLQALERNLRSELADVADRGLVLKRINESFSGSIQLSSTKACLTEEPEKELETLSNLYLDSRHSERPRDVTGRKRILGIMQNEFERAGVWKLMKHQIPVADYTQAGDPLKIDCGYKPNGVMKMFHAVALTTNIDLAKILAFTYPLMAAGMAKKNIAADLTAVVDTLDRSRTDVAFALGALERSAISIAATEDMPLIADRARQELHA